jgi:hypothetical protein
MLTLLHVVHTVTTDVLAFHICSYCYDNPSSADPALGNADLATKLKFKLGGMDGHFIGKLPASLCPGVDSPEVVKLLVKVDFRVASGNQYDRSYVLKIGDAVVSMCFTALDKDNAGSVADAPEG